jgi:hypothetical protein
MAFVAIFLIFLIIAVCVLVFIGFIGLVIFIVSLIKRHSDKRNGRKVHKLGMIVGIVILMIPIGIVGSIVGSMVVSSIRTRIARMGYTNVTDRWRNEWVSERQAEEDVISCINEAVESGDKSAVAGLFSQNVQRDSALTKQIDDFFAECPTDLSSYTADYQGGSSGGDGDTESFDCSYELKRDDEVLYVSFGGCCHNREDKDEVGLEDFSIRSEKAEVLTHIESDDNSASKYIIAEINVAEDFETRRVWGHPYRFTPMDRSLTKAEVVDAVQNSRSLSDLVNAIGEPNGNCESGKRVVYEVESPDDKPRYAVVYYDYYERVEKNNVYFASDEGDFEAASE